MEIHHGKAMENTLTGYRLAVLVVWLVCFGFRGLFVCFLRRNLHGKLRRVYTCGQTLEEYLQALPFFFPPAPHS